MVIGSPKKFDVTVHGKGYRVAVYRDYKTVWCVVGFVGTERIEGKGISEAGALRAWEMNARYWADGTAGQSALRER
jgi:hypothetical protein